MGVVSVVGVRIGEWLGVCGLVVVVWASVVREVSGSGGGRGRRGGFGSGSEGRWYLRCYGLLSCV